MHNFRHGKVSAIGGTEPKLTNLLNAAQILRIVKICTIILLVGCLHATAAGYGQKITLNERDVSLTKIFKEIKKQTGFRFFYLSQQMEEARRVSISVSNASMEEVLEKVFEGQPFGYEVKEKTVIINLKNTATNNVTQNTVASDPIDVTGKVTDDKGNPLAGANVKIRGTNIGTTTNNDGGFILKNVSDNAVLEISYVGLEMKTFTVRGTGFINIALDQKLSMLDETVVIAYGQTTRRFATGNIASVKAEDIEKQPVQNPLLALQGRVPGIEITQLSGMNGAGVTVRIQGRNSINSGLEPLIVVDGVPYPVKLFDSGLEALVQGGSPLNYINSSDIESIDILKDAEATAIYGSRAANGAILITTKKGKAGRATFNVNLQQGWGKVTRHVDMMNTRQYLDMRYEAYKNAGIDISTLTPDGSNYDLTFWDTTRYTNWQKTLIGGTAQYTNINAGVSGGTTNLQYLVGGTYKRQTTVFPGSFDDKVGSLHFNINGTSNNQKFRLQLTGNYSYDQNHLPGVDLTSQAIIMEPNAPPLYNTNGTLNWAQSGGRSSWINPLAYAVSTDFNNTTKNLISSAVLSYRILQGLDVRISFGYTDMRSDLYLPTRLEVNRPERRATSQRFALYGNRNMSSWIIEPQLQYTRSLGKSKLDGLLGTTIQKSSAQNLSLLGSGFSSDLLMKTLRAATSTSVSASSSEITRFNALFGRLNYNLRDKYLISLTARRDGSNKFGDKNKFQNFWSVGAGWIFSEENWMKQYLTFLSFGKLRISYGITGNDQIPAFSYLSLYYINNPGILYQNNFGLNPLGIPNPYLQWEETRKWQNGLDLGFIQDRIVIGATYTRNRSSNQLVSYVLPNLTGFGNITKNLPATIQNTSWEVLVNAGIIKTKNFSLNSSINLTIPHNKVLSFPGIEFTPYANGENGIIVGEPIGVIKVWKYVGINPSTGQYLFLDKNNSPTMSPIYPDDKTLLISKLPKWYGGWSNSIRYRGFQLDILFQFVRKMGPRDLHFYNGTTYPGQFFRGNSNQPVTVLNRWQKAGDNGNVSLFFPDDSYSYENYFISNSDAWYNYDASYIRLKNFSLSWQLPTGWIQKAYLKNARLYVHGQNIATITNYTGLDPETMSSGSLPPLRMWTVGGQIEF